MSSRPRWSLQRFVTVISGVNLTRQILYGEPKRPGFGFEVEAHLVLAGGEIGTDLVNTVEFSQPFHQLIGSGQDIVHIVPLEPHLDGVTGGAGFHAGKGQGFDARQDADLLFPQHHQLLGVNPPGFRIQKDGLNGTIMGPTWGISPRV
jgi:hypothetical protein